MLHLLRMIKPARNFNGNGDLGDCGCPSELCSGRLTLLAY